LRGGLLESLHHLRPAFREGFVDQIEIIILDAGVVLGQEDEFLFVTEGFLTPMEDFLFAEWVHAEQGRRKPGLWQSRSSGSQAFKKAWFKRFFLSLK
jgi:hypothetical protein